MANAYAWAAERRSDEFDACCLCSPRTRAPVIEHSARGEGSPRHVAEASLALLLVLRVVDVKVVEDRGGRRADGIRLGCAIVDIGIDELAVQFVLRSTSDSALKLDDFSDGRCAEHRPTLERVVQDGDKVEVSFTDPCNVARGIGIRS